MRPRTVGNQARAICVMAGLILLAVGAVYSNSLGGEFVFDDLPSIVDNPAIRQWGTAMNLRHAEGGLTVNGRPLVGLSLALNYALGGTCVTGYHVFNLIVHGAAALALFGVVRRTLSATGGNREGTSEFAGPHGTWLAACLALLWALHPLQTESVAYVIQRAEALAGLWYLLTIYGFIRGAEGDGSRRWLGFSVAACLLGTLSKEIIVTAPLVVLLHDRTFFAGSFRAAWARRRGYYIALAGTWLVLSALVFAAQGRGGTAGWDVGISPWTYALTQGAAIMTYLKLVFWPAPLVFDYGPAPVSGWSAWLGLLCVAMLGSGAIWALRRRPVLGYCGAVFFLILAPSSSVVPIATQTMAEHRMYLPLAVIMVLMVLGLARVAGRGFWPVGLIIAAGLAGLTVARNHDYRSGLALWSDTAVKRPGNARARNNLGYELFLAGRVDEAVACYRRALLLDAGHAEAHFNLGVALARQGRMGEAVAAYEQAVGLQPGFAQAHSNLGLALEAAGRLSEALKHYETALGLASGYAPAFYQAGTLLAQLGRMKEAADRLEAAVRLKPAYLEARNNLANVLLELDRVPEAIAQYEAVLRQNSEFVPARRNLARVLVELGRKPEAIVHYGVLLRLQPEDPGLREELRRLEAR